MTNRFIIDLRSKRLPASIGSKASNLRRLIDRGLRVPVTYVCTWEAYQAYLQNDLEMLKVLEAELQETLKPNLLYAVRSSANLEDTLASSFAGQFKTNLNIQGATKVLQAIWSTWATAQTPAVQSYLEKMGNDKEPLKMAVIIQEMVQPVLSGVAFSKNPLTGISEVIVEAVKDYGTALVQEGSTPLRWVNRWGNWVTKAPESEVDLQFVEGLVAQVRRIARLFKKDIDLEWVYNGKEIYWLQMREITTLHNVEIFSNKMAREMLPGMIKPLIWSINIPLIDTVWINLLSEVIGKNDLTPEKLTRQFYYRLYFNMTNFGRVMNRLGLPTETLEMMMGLDAGGARLPMPKMNMKMIGLLPRILVFMLDKWNTLPKAASLLPQIEAEYRTFSVQPGNLSEKELLQEIDRLFQINQRLVYFNIIVPLLLAVYQGILRTQLGRRGIDFEQLDLTEGLEEELSQYQPDRALAALNRRYLALDEASRRQIADASFEDFLGMPNLQAFQEEFCRFLNQFGHLSDSGNDFSAVPWREQPRLILELISNYQYPPPSAARGLRFANLNLNWADRLALGIIYRRARDYHRYRERIGSLYTYGYGLFRPYFLALAARLVQRGLVEAPADIFYLYLDEVRQAALDPAQAGQDWRALVAQRKQDMERCREASLPTMIFGDQPPPLHTNVRHTLIGTPTSRGYYKGRVRQVRGLSDFPKVQSGDVLVVPYTDVGWTPLFAKAGGVISESGGMLSHSSIIAREYKIPAVVSVSEANLLPDNILVTVDGYKGEIVVHAE